MRKYDDKFFTGDKLSIYDLYVGSYLIGVFLNPDGKHSDLLIAAMDKAPDRVKKYIADFQAEMPEYLANRPKGGNYIY